LCLRKIKTASIEYNIARDYNLKGGCEKLNIKLNVRSIFKINTKDEEMFIALFNDKLLKIIISLENQTQGRKG